LFAYFSEYIIMPLKLVLSGPPASGKGTQCEKIAQDFQLPHISTGALLRELPEDSPLGQQAKELMEAGQLVPDEMIIEIVTNRLAEPDCAAGFLLDGFPRNESQANLLLSRFSEGELKLIVLEVSDDTCVSRVCGRRVDPETGNTYHVEFNPPPSQEIADRCVTRADDSEETMRSRLQLYHEQLNPILSVFPQASTFKLNAGDGKTPSDIYEEVHALLQNLSSSGEQKGEEKKEEDVLLREQKKPEPSPFHETVDPNSLPNYFATKVSPLLSPVLETIAIEQPGSREEIIDRMINLLQGMKK
jgi:adenylate kinase